MCELSNINISIYKCPQIIMDDYESLWISMDIHELF